MTDVFVGLYPPLVSTPLDTADIGSLAAGGTATATLEWDSAGNSDGVFNLSVAVGGGGQDPDRDDGAWVSAVLRNTVAIASASLASKDNVAGNPVSINVQVSNKSSADTLDGATVDLFVGDSKTSRDTATADPIAPGSAADVTLTWDTTGVDPGQYALMVKANAPGFGSDADDQVSISVPLRAARVQRESHASGSETPGRNHRRDAGSYRHRAQSQRGCGVGAGSSVFARWNKADDAGCNRNLRAHRSARRRDGDAELGHRQRIRGDA